MSNGRGAMGNVTKTHVCPIDRRQFASRAALKQHRQAAHPPNQMPVQRAPRMRSRGGGNRPQVMNPMTRSVTGTDLLPSTRELTTSDDTGLVLASLPISPQFRGTRLQAESALWSRWRPLSLQLQIISSAGSATSGAYCVGFTYDPHTRLGSGAGNINTVVAMRPSVTSNIHQGVTFAIPCDSIQKWYNVSGSEDADSIHGRVFVVLLSPIGNLTSGSRISLQLRLTWKVLFEGPALPRAVSSRFIYADAGYENYFTDSVSDWASGKKLTLKHAEGGSAVPFSDAAPATIYTLDDKAQLKYYKAGAADPVPLKYAVRIPNYSVAAFAVFDDAAKAKLFKDGGDSANCLDYVKAGPYVSPSNPVWVETLTAPKPPSELELKIQRLEQQILDLNLKLGAVDSQSPCSSSAASFTAEELAESKQQDF